jgi:hypothetical protein
MLYETTINGETRKVVANFSRNGFYYTLDRGNGQFIRADQFQEKVTWTKGIDPKTGKPLDYDPTKNVQLYAGVGVMRGKPGQESCPWWNGSPTFFPPTLDARKSIAYVAGAEGCISTTISKSPMVESKDYVGLPPCCTEQGRITAHGAIWAMDLKTGKLINKVTLDATDPISFQLFFLIGFKGATFKDFLPPIFKATVFGLIIGLVASFQGIRTRGGTEGVGRATTRTVVLSAVRVRTACWFSGSTWAITRLGR